eukprot:m.240564 g.240564  ORF g.240564 m.240564 type:complete len:217 (+) comp40195_c1_seq69:2806-3456(+)
MQEISAQGSGFRWVTWIVLRVGFYVFLVTGLFSNICWMASFQSFLRLQHKEPFRKLCLEFDINKTIEQSAFAVDANAPVQGTRLKTIAAPPERKTKTCADFQKNETAELILEKSVDLNLGLATNLGSAVPLLRAPDLHSLQSEKFCPVCRKKLRSPVSAPCKHSCCFNCWKECLKNAKKCPVCSLSVYLRETHIYFIETIFRYLIKGLQCSSSLIK